MLKISVTDKGGIEQALKQYKSKVIRTRQMSTLRDLKEFEKPSIKRRRMAKKAKYVQQKFGDKIKD
jgi:small subunit ribosomal protein S21